MHELKDWAVSSMRDVARLAGVSTATVSAVLNGKGTVSPELTLRVEKAMQALDYHPDQIARSLRVGRSNVIGMIVPDVSNLF
jgi:LacI family transcriptional regulator